MLFHSFYGWGIWAWLWVTQLQGLSQGFNLNITWGCGLIWKFDQGRIFFQAHHMVVSKIEFFTGLPQFLDMWASPWDSSQHGSCLPPESASERAREGKAWSQSPFITWSWKWHSFTFFALLLYTRRKLLGITHTQGEGSTQECEYQESGIILEAAYHMWARYFIHSFKNYLLSTY